jgi:hypothetical protein
MLDIFSLQGASDQLILASPAKRDYKNVQLVEHVERDQHSRYPGSNVKNVHSGFSFEIEKVD